MLPHVGVGEYCETKKAYYFGLVYFFYIVCFHVDDLVSTYYTIIAPQIYHSSATSVCTWTEG